MSLFADVPASSLADSCAFWAAVTASRPGRPSGEDGEYLPMDVDHGDRYLWLQRIGSPTPGWHLDLHVRDVDAAACAAAERDASVARTADGLVTLRSPAGQPFCFVAEEPQRTRRRPRPPAWPAGRSRLDQVCIDIPASVFDAEADFWAALTGWPRDGVRGRCQEFDRLRSPDHLPLGVLLQRLGGDDADGPRMHADLAAEDRRAECGRHEELGARVMLVAEHWTTLRDPAGLVYCITDRRPD